MLISVFVMIINQSNQSINRLFVSRKTHHRLDRQDRIKTLNTLHLKNSSKLVLQSYNYTQLHT